MNDKVMIMQNQLTPVLFIILINYDIKIFTEKRDILV